MPSRCRGRSRSRKITYNTITKKQEQKRKMMGENKITLQISDEDGNIIAIAAERTVSMQEIFDFYAKCKKYGPTQPMIFIHNGVPISPHHTPNILDLKDGDIILEMKKGASRLFESLVALQLHTSHRSHLYLPMLDKISRT